MIETIALICTLLGGIAAIWYFFEKTDFPKRIARIFRREPKIPLDPRSLFAYINGSADLKKLTDQVAAQRNLAVRQVDGESAWLNEVVNKLKIENTRELNLYVTKYGSQAVKLTNYLAPEKEIDGGFILSMVLEIHLLETVGKDGSVNFHRELKYSTGGEAWANEMFTSYQQVKQYH